MKDKNTDNEIKDSNVKREGSSFWAGVMIGVVACAVLSSIALVNS